MNGASLGRSPSKNHRSFSAQEVEEYFKNQEVLCEQGLQSGKRRSEERRGGKECAI